MEIFRAVPIIEGGFNTTNSKVSFTLGIILIFIISAIFPITIGYNIKITNEIESQSTMCNNGGLMDSAWPMYGCDVRHTGRSCYGSPGNHLVEKWKVELDRRVDPSPSLVIAKDGTIYLPCGTGDTLYAISPNGTIKWIFEGGGYFGSPALAEDGTIYFKSRPNTFYALYPSGTRKWSLSLGEAESSPAIDYDGTIYVGGGNSLYAIYPNSTIKWQFNTDGSTIMTSPAIDDNTVYIASSYDGNLYALFSNNGTLKWKTNINHHGECWSSPVIGDDGNIYVLGGFKLWCISSDGEKIWVTNTSMLSGPTIGYDGTIYIYLNFDYLAAYNPDGTMKWEKFIGCTSRATIASNGMIYIGGWQNAYPWEYETARIFQFSPEGKVLSSCKITSDYPYLYSSIFTNPVIAEDGTIYVGSYFVNGDDKGYLHAFEVVDIENEPPEKPVIDGPRFILPNIKYTYSADSTDPDGDDVCYFFKWNDGSIDWTTFVPSGNSGKASHYWERWIFDIQIEVIAMDVHGGMSDWSIYDINSLFNRVFSDSALFYSYLEGFPLLQKLLLLIK